MPAGTREVASALVVVEDSYDDYYIIRRALERAGNARPIVHMATGEQVLDYLLRRGPYQREGYMPRPAMILLDLHLPGLCGRQVLRRMQMDGALEPVPVIVFTGSEDPRDEQECRQLGAAGFLRKPEDPEQFAQAVLGATGQEPVEAGQPACMATTV